MSSEAPALPRSTARQRIAVLGAGSWGTALAKALGDAGHEVRLWARRPELAAQLNEQRENREYLPGSPLPATVACKAELGACVAGADTILLVVPSHGLRQVLRTLAPQLAPQALLLSCAKGIEAATLMTPAQMVEEELGVERSRATFACLGGPSFAREVAAGAPTAVCVAAHAPEVALALQQLLRSETLRVYTTEDVVGVELGGALKNVMAIAVGCSEGLGFGHNARAALITRGLAEMTRLAVTLGAHPLTLAGLSGLGDLVLTCTGDLSRNRRVGLQLGQGQSVDAVLGGMGHMVAEGVRTAESAHRLALREGVDMPIVRQAYEVLHCGKEPREAVAELLARPPRPERA